MKRLRHALGATFLIAAEVTAELTEVLDKAAERIYGLGPSK